MSKSTYHISMNGRRLRRMRVILSRLIRSARDAHWRAEIYFLSGSLDGSKMRNLDDLVMHLEDARTNIREYLQPTK